MAFGKAADKPRQIRDAFPSTFIAYTVSLVGNIATDIELKDVGEKRVASFLLAVGRGNGRDAGADFVWVSAWDRQGELCAEYLEKGARVGIEGRLKSRTWEQDGRRRDAIEVVARRIDFLGGGRRAEEGAEVMPFAPAAV